MSEAHSPLGPSALSRVLACPASFALSQSPEVKNLGRYRPSIYAVRGTVAHRVAETLISGGAVSRETIHEAGHDIEVDDALIDAVSVYVEVCEDLASVADWYSAEQRISLDEYWLPNTPPVPIFGTSDFLAYHAATRRLTVVDYKHGAGVAVAVDDNPQVYAYAAGALLQVPEPVATVDLVIVQPNIERGEKVKRSTVAAIDVLSWVHEVLMPGIRRTEAEPETYVPGAQCRFCPGAVLCPALQKRAHEQAASQFTSVNPAGLGPDELAEELALADLAELWIKQIRDLAKSKLEAGDTIPGWMLVPTRPTRSWINENEVMGALSALGTAHDVMFETHLRSPAQLEKRLSKQEWTSVALNVQAVSSGTKLAKEGN